MKAIIEVSARGSVFRNAARQVHAARKGRARDDRAGTQLAFAVPTGFPDASNIPSNSTELR